MDSDAYGEVNGSLGTKWLCGCPVCGEGRPRTIEESSLVLDTLRISLHLLNMHYDCN